jgi:hypothetical protein
LLATVAIVLCLLSSNSRQGIAVPVI